MNVITKHCVAPLLAGITLFCGTQPQDPERDAHRGLVAAFPQTAELLEHVRANDPALFEQLDNLGRSIDRTREQRALAFAQEHHPDLARLLRGLGERKRKKAYRAAIDDLSRDVSRIEAVRRRSDSAYEAALNAWRFESKLRMKSARLVAQPEKADEAAYDDLQRLARVTVEAERAQLERRAARLRDQLARIDARLQKSTDQVVAERIGRVRTRVRRQAKAREQKRRGKAPSEGKKQ